MKNIVHAVVFSSLSTLSAMVYATGDDTDPSEIYSSMRAQMERACPAIWEDLGADMDTSSLNGDVWASGAAGAADKAEFKALMQEVSGDTYTDDQIETSASDLATVATECASHRVALLDALISKTPRDVLLAMDAVNRGMNKTIEYLDGGWAVGDVRITGRMVPQDGWVFLVGQTVYNELFELAKKWAPNTGNENWDAGDLVTLPDMRGRTLVAADNMGGSSKNLNTHVEADKIGGMFGTQRKTLTQAHLPKHSHTMNTNGSHTHPVTPVGNHAHNQKASAYSGTSNWGTHEYGGQVQGRTRAENTITKSIQENGGHKHGMSNAGNHVHVVNEAGSGESFTIVQPSITFNVEMKY